MSGRIEKFHDPRPIEGDVMTNVDVNRVELVWPGKYDENGKLKSIPKPNLPFQVIETINASRTNREKQHAPQTSLFDTYYGTEGDSFNDGWKNKLIWGDNYLILSSLLNRFAGSVGLIYIDPPFATGDDFTLSSDIGEDGLEVQKKRSILEEKAYRDTWGRGIKSYLSMMFSRLSIMKELLNDTGNICVHIDWHVGHYIKTILDEIFGRENFRAEIIWQRSLGHHLSSKGLDVMTDSIYWYSKTSSYIFNQPYAELSEKDLDLKFPHIEEETGRRFTHRQLEQSQNVNSRGETRIIDGKEVKTDQGWRWSQETIDQRLKENPHLIYWTSNNRPRYKIYADEYKGRKIGNLWTDISPLSSNSQERVEIGYPTQKPEALLERIIESFSNKDDLVADFFCGSGTTLKVAENLKRRWIGADLNRYAIHTSRKRMLEVRDCKPFEILNLGKYERQYWQDVLFNIEENNRNEKTIFEYLSFILNLYDAKPVSGLNYIHGKKDETLIHIGAIDSNVTIDEVVNSIEECIEVGKQELHILGWEWEMGLAGPNNDYKKGGLLHEQAKEKGIKLLLFQIPREVMEQQAVDQGDIQFFELAYLDVNIEKFKDSSVKVNLKDFVIPNTELIPEEVRDKIDKWSDYIDYWAVDWDFHNDTFMQGWVTYRTKQDRNLELSSPVHMYDEPGKYRILVKVIDIFGNDTTQAYDVEV